MDVQTSRRALIGALALSPFSAAAIATPASVSASRSAFAEAVAKHDAALAREEAFDRTYCDPANDAARAAKARVPRTIIMLGKRPLATDDWRAAASCREALKSQHLPAHDRAAASAFVAAYDARIATITALPEVIHADAMTDRSDRLLDERCEWRDAAIEAPVANLAELARKFELMDVGESQVPERFLTAFRGDLERLIAGGRA